MRLSPHLAMSCLTVLVSLWVGDGASAQDVQNAQDSSTIDTQFRAMGRALSSPELPATVPATAANLALARQYLEQAGYAQGLVAVEDAVLAKEKAQFSENIKAQPAKMQATLKAIFDRSFHEAEEVNNRALVDGTANYIATRLTYDELKSVVDFYGAGIGFKMLHHGQDVTPEERQEAGRYVFGHPGMIKFMSVSVGLMKNTGVQLPARRAAFHADFDRRFCRALTEVHLKMSTCPAPGS